MNRPPHAAASLPDPTIRMSEGWHCLHMYYQVDAAALAGLDDDARARGRDELIRALDPGADGAPERLQVSVISGHRAELGLLLLSL